jgi:hypothetical protein
MRLGLRHLRLWVDGWRAAEPLAQEHLTGCFLGARREVLEELGGYDEGYPCYYEDSDLFVRARRAGRRLYLLPESEVIHYGHRSVAMIWDEAMKKSRIGRSRYMRLHHGMLASWWDSFLIAFVRAARRLHKARPRPEPVELGTLDTPPRLELPAPGPCLFELAFDPFFLLSVGRFDASARPEISRVTWESLLPTDYHLRALDPATLKPVIAWSFRKV